MRRGMRLVAPGCAWMCLDAPGCAGMGLDAPGYIALGTRRIVPSAWYQAHENQPFSYWFVVTLV